MRIMLGLGLLVLLGCGPSLADTVYYRCVKAMGKQTNPNEVMLLIIDPLLGEMNAERYSMGDKEPTYYDCELPGSAL